jgi:hypothetical protein
VPGLPADRPQASGAGSGDRDALPPVVPYPLELDIEKAVRQPRAGHPQPGSEHEGPLEPAHGDPAVQEASRLRIGSAPASNHYLSAFYRHAKLVDGKPRDRKGDAQPAVAGGQDIAWRIPVARAQQPANEGLKFR